MDELYGEKAMGKFDWPEQKTNKMYRINRSTNFKWETQNISAQNNWTWQLYSWGEIYLWKWKHGGISQTSGGHRVSPTQPGGKHQVQLMPSALQGPESSQERFTSSVNSGLRSPQDAKHLSLHVPLPLSSFPPAATVYPKVCSGFVYLGIDVQVEGLGTALKYCSLATMPILIVNFLYLRGVELALHRATWWTKGGQAKQIWIGPSCWMLVSMTTAPFCASGIAQTVLLHRAPLAGITPFLGVWEGQRAVVHVLKTHAMSRGWHTAEMLQRKIYIVP